MSSGKRSDSQEFKDWLHAHEVEFRDLIPADIAYRAILNGFDPLIVRQWESHERFLRMGQAS